MKTLKSAITIVIVGLLIAASNVVMARGWGGGSGMGQGVGPGGEPGPGWALGEEMYNAKIAVLAELSGKSKDAIKTKLEYKPFWVVIDEYKIDYNVFKTKMKAKATAIVEKAAKEGKISKDQAEFMLLRIKQGPGPGMGRGFGGGHGFGPCSRF